jgi:hypothetical protein
MIQPGSVTPTQNNELVVTGIGTSIATGTPTVNGGFTVENTVPLLGGQYFGGGLADLVQTAATPANPLWTWSGTGNLVAVIMTFKAAAQVTGFPSMM